MNTSATVAVMAIWIGPTLAILAEAALASWRARHEAKKQRDRRSRHHRHHLPTPKRHQADDDLAF
jgi:hypothetical protein